MKAHINNAFLRLAATCLASAALTTTSAFAAALTWDTVSGDAPTITPGSGTWNLTDTTWYNGSTNVTWSQTNTTTAVDRAILGGSDAAADTYLITLSGQLASTGLKIDNSGYKLDGGTLYLRNNGTGNTTSVAEIVDGKTLTIASAISGPANTALYWLAGENATVNITGDSTAALQPIFMGESGTGTQGTFNFSGTYSYTVPTLNARVNIIGNANFSSTASLFIGRGGRPTVNLVTSSTGIVTLDGAGAVLSHNSSNSNNHTMIGRDGGTGTLVIKNGTFNTATTGTAHDLAIVQDNTNFSSGTFDVQGGTVNVGSTTNNTAKINFGRLGLRTNQTAIMTQSGGTINSYGGILFGGTETGTYAGTATWTMTGGSLYLGAGGISEGTFSANEAITLSGGMIGTLASWTGSLPMTLASTNGDVTFQAADSASTPFDITLTNTLSGSGGLKKTGAGTLTLNGANTFTGATAISNGTLALGAGGSLASSPLITVASGATYNVASVTGGYSLGTAQTLAGSGSVVGAMNVSGTLSPGTSPGIMATGNQTWSDGGDYNWQIANATGAAGTGFDQIQVTGTLDLSNLTTGRFSINMWSLSAVAPDADGDAMNWNFAESKSWDILTATGGITGFEAADFLINTSAINGTAGFSNSLGGGGFSLTASTNNLTLNFTPVPEASSALAILLVGAGFFRRRRI